MYNTVNRQYKCKFAKIDYKVYNAGVWKSGERLGQAKIGKEERVKQQKIAELIEKEREHRLAREKEQQEILLIEQKRIQLRRDLDRFNPKTLLLGIKQEIWKKGSLKDWEHIWPSDPKKHWAYKGTGPKDYKYQNDSIWYAATGLVYKYTDLLSSPGVMGIDGYPYSGPYYYRGTSTLALVIGIGIFLPKNERLIFLSDDIPNGLIQRRDAITQVSDPEATHKLQDLLIKQAIAVTPSGAAEAAREELKARGK